jgi:hypothetical protein
MCVALAVTVLVVMALIDSRSSLPILCGLAVAVIVLAWAKPN